MHAATPTSAPAGRSLGTAGRRSRSVGVPAPRAGGLAATPAPLPAPTGRRRLAAAAPPPPPRHPLHAGRRPAAATAATAGGGAAAPSPSPSPSSLASFVAAFWAFLRPHTIRGTVLGSIAVTGRALLELGGPAWAGLDWAGLLPRAALGVLALLAGNGYIVGINQIYDVDIDAVNKPFLPIAAGRLSPGVAWALVACLAAAGLAVSATQFGAATTSLYALGLVLGTLYSVPPFRLKRWAVPAFAIIATVRGFLLNYGVFAAVRAALGLPFVWSPAVAFITTFVTLFAVAIAITKDLADVEGDRAFGVETFATRLGVAKVAGLGVGILALNYVGAIALALTHPSTFFRPRFAAAAHAVLGAGLARLAATLRSTGYSRTGVTDFYRGVWALFYAEYALLPFL